MTTKLNETIQLGNPIEHRGVVIAPLFPRLQPRVEYLTLEEAIPLGFVVREVDSAGSVPELVAHNPLEANVLLYDGEELLGAKQNRILNVTVLVAAQSETLIPVSCVEEGRWSARSAHFSDAQHTAYPQLRRRKAEQLSAAPLTLGLAQSDVWDELSAKADRLGAHSPTGAQADIFQSSKNELATLRPAFPLLPGQSGALLALGDDRLCLDYISRPDAFGRLYSKLLEGYLLDAIERLDTEPATEERLHAFVASVAAAARSRHPSAGVGEDIRLRGDYMIGSGLEHDEELIQLCAFTRDEDGAEHTRVARPSRRRLS